MSTDPRCLCSDPPTNCHAGCPLHGIKTAAVQLAALGLRSSPPQFNPTIRYDGQDRCPKLAITRDRIELKLPEKVRDQEEGYVRLAWVIAMEVGTPEFSLRGKFYAAVPGKLRISMYYDSRRELWGTREIVVPGKKPSIAYVRTLVGCTSRRWSRAGSPPSRLHADQGS